MAWKRPLRQALLRLFYALGRPFVADEQGSKRPQRVLLIRPDHIGDMLFTTPALRLLRRALPDAEISYMVGPWAAEVVERNHNVDRIIRCDCPGFSRRPKGWVLGPYMKMLQWAGQLRGQGFDLALNLRFDFWWGALLAYLAGIPRRVGYEIEECRPFLTEKVPFVPCHAVEQNLKLIEKMCGVSFQKDRDDLSLEYTPTEGERESINKLLREQGISDEDRLVAIHPGATSEVKSWREDWWARVADILSERDGVRIILTGGPGDVALCKQVQETMENPCVVLAGNTTLGELAALLQRCSLVLGADSGPLHLAVAMGTPTVHLYGPSDPLIFGPWGDQRKHVVLQTPFPCAPCGVFDYPAAELPYHRCLWVIGPEKVLAAAEKLFRGEEAEDVPGPRPKRWHRHARL